MGLPRQPQFHSCPTMAMDGVVRADKNAIQRRREAEPVKAAGEGLFRHMGMVENPPAQDDPIGTEDLKRIGIMVPSGICMAKGGGDRPAAVRALMRAGLQHIRFPGDGWATGKREADQGQDKGGETGHGEAPLGNGG